MIVDAHLHIWDPGRADYPWITPGPFLRAFAVEDVEDEFRAAHVDAAVLVQAADNVADTAVMLAEADASELVAGVVAWMPLDDRSALERTLAERDPRVVGARVLIHDRADPRWIVREAAAGLGMLAAAGVRYDYVTAGPDALVHVPTISEHHPDLHLVIDHLGKPPIGGSDAERHRWRGLLATAAQNPLVHAKLSGLSPAGIAGAPESFAADIRPFVDDALEVFGPERLMIGGDWPISLSVGGFTRAWTSITDCLDALTDSERAAVMGGTATRFYGLATKERKLS